MTKQQKKKLKAKLKKQAQAQNTATNMGPEETQQLSGAMTTRETVQVQKKETVQKPQAPSEHASSDTESLEVP